MVSASVAVVLVAVLAAAGCGAGSAGGAGGPPPVAAEAPPGRSGPAAIVNGVWDGWYDCAQGRTGLTLTITEDGRGPGLLAARFSFYPLPENLAALAGVFMMTGEQLGGQITLEPGEWIDRPGSYRMVGLTAQLTGETPQRLTGVIEDSGCGQFEVERVETKVVALDAPLVDDGMAGTWEGDYRCGLVRRGLRLVVTPATDNRFQATFEFFPLPGEQEEASPGRSPCRATTRGTAWWRSRTAGSTSPPAT